MIPTEIIIKGITLSKKHNITENLRLQPMARPPEMEHRPNKVRGSLICHLRPP